ncbi:DgyrCDS6938 [Dimorphilus gyrociliatus]|uniref:DgyrCDS6938 n=1 Tax=Dimorphilus gyrociliatus TaxID=2664684 RepID=A0A7I8VPH6_9ANNE|nr:DgyrCDS6938 [Dimorphilus gyrociliatus]
MPGGPKLNKSAQTKSRSIDQQLEEGREKQHDDLQLLILGGAGSGKSTFIKQLRLRHGDKFPESERKTWTIYVYENLVEALYPILEQVTEWEDGSNAKTYSLFVEKFPRSNIGRKGSSSQEEDHSKKNVNYSKLSSLAADVLSMWRDKSVQTIWQENIKKFGLRKTFADHFLSKLERILSTNYIPDIEDILFIRKPTASVQEHMFTSEGNVYKVIDVAGQRSQRHKWISLFEGVTAIVFITSLTSYSEGTYEDSSLNSLHDSLSAFGSVITNQFLKNTNFILLLNKKDLLGKRLADVPFSSIIENYKGRRVRKYA